MKSQFYWLKYQFCYTRHQPLLLCEVFKDEHEGIEYRMSFDECNLPLLLCEADYSFLERLIQLESQRPNGKLIIQVL